MPAEMGLQVARLSVHLSAAGNVATVDVALPEMSSSWTETVSFLTIRAIASSPTGITTG